MVLTSTERIRYTTNNSFGEIIKKFRDGNIKKQQKLLKEIFF